MTTKHIMLNLLQNLLLKLCRLQRYLLLLLSDC
jgi:hypothetical protein